MASINIYQLDKGEVMEELDLHHSSTVQNLAEYLRLTAAPGYRDKPEHYYIMAAKEVIYQKCLQTFRFYDGVTDAHSALRYTLGYSYSLELYEKLEEARRMAPIKAEQERKAAQLAAEKEAARIEKLKKKCEKRGLDFEKENQKEQKKIANLKENPENYLLRLCLIFAIPAIIFSILRFAFPTVTLITSIHPFSAALAVFPLFIFIVIKVFKIYF